MSAMVRRAKDDSLFDVNRSINPDEASAFCSARFCVVEHHSFVCGRRS